MRLRERLREIVRLRKGSGYPITAKRGTKGSSFFIPKICYKRRFFSKNRAFFPKIASFYSKMRIIINSY
jgi:hypothetical protein